MYLFVFMSIPYIDRASDRSGPDAGGAVVYPGCIAACLSALVLIDGKYASSATAERKVLPAT